MWIMGSIGKMEVDDKALVSLSILEVPCSSIMVETEGPNWVEGADAE